MSREMAFILSLSILFPFVAGVVRYKNVTPIYKPLIYMLIVGLANEVVCFFIPSISQKAIPTNIYYLFEFLLLAWQFKQWKNILKRKYVFEVLLAIFICLWIADYLIINNLERYNLIFQVTSSLVLILMAVNQLNWLIVNERDVITRNPIFIICTAIIIFFSYKIMGEIFYFYAPERMKSNIFEIEAYLNVAYNILLFIALLCIAPKKVFTPRFQ